MVHGRPGIDIRVVVVIQAKPKTTAAGIVVDIDTMMFESHVEQ